MGANALTTERSEHAPNGAAKRPILSEVQRFRGFSIFLIVAIHCVVLFDWSSSRALEDAVRKILANGTLFFVLIGGFLFEYLHPTRLSSVDFFRKKFVKVLMPYFFCSLPALAVIAMAPGVRGASAVSPDWALWQQAAYYLATGAHVAPFWFIPSILLMYLVAPVFWRVSRSDRALIALAVLMFPLCLMVQRSAGNPLQTAIHFLPIWIVGMAMARFFDSFKRFVQTQWLSFALVISLLLAWELFFVKGTHSNWSVLGKLLSGMALLAVFDAFQGWIANQFEKLADYSFGVFFLHSYLITAARLLMDYSSIENPKAGLLTLGAATVAVLVLCVLILRATVWLVGSKRSRWLVGV